MGDLPNIQTVRSSQKIAVRMRLRGMRLRSACEKEKQSDEIADNQR